MHAQRRVAVLVAGMFFGAAIMAQAATTSGTGTTPSSDGSTGAITAPGQVRVARMVASPFATLAGSQDNAVALATALRTGTPATLTSTSTVDGKPVTTTTTITPPTKAMGWGNVSHALALAQYSLAQAGVAQPTAADLQAALVGGSVTTADGKSIQLAGVLQQRASGMGWGQIARSYDTTMGAVNRGVKSPPTVATAGAGKTATTSSTATAAGKGVTTASGTAPAKSITTASGTASAKGITTASGTGAHGGHASKGVTTAGGTTGSGVTTAAGGGSGTGTTSAAGQGHGNAYGRGIVTGTGSAAPTTVAVNHGGGVTTASGTVRGSAAGTEHGNGRGKGGG